MESVFLAKSVIDHERRDAIFNLARMRLCINSLIGVCALIQCLFFWDVESNVYCALVVALFSWVAFNAIFDPACFEEAPVPALMIFFFNLSSLSGALILKTLEGTALVSNLRVPVTTFNVLGFSILLMLVSLWAYRRFPIFTHARNALSQSLWRPLGLFNWPEDSVFWVLGMIGAVATLLAKADDAGVDAGVFTKFLVGLTFLRYAPFLIAFRSLGEVRGARISIPLYPLIAYFGLMVGLGMVQNSRGTFIDALMMCACALMLVLGFGKASLKWLSPQKILIGCVLGFFAYWLMTRLALAMVAVRPYRESVGLMQLIGLSIEAFFNPTWTSAYETGEVATVYIGDYGENYVSSRLLSRLLMVKFHDNMFYYLSLYDNYSVNLLASYLLDCLIGILPAPVLDLLGIDFDKAVLRQSLGDYVIYLVDGWGLGGYKTGSMIASVYSISPFVFPVLMFFSFIVMYVIYDSIRDVKKGLSPLLLLMLWGLVGTLGAFGFSSESISVNIAGVIRGIPQFVLLYLSACWVGKWVSALWRVK
jgi:hypothetical protein